MKLTGYLMQQREKKEKEKTEEYLIEKKVDCQIVNLIDNLIYSNCFYLLLYVKFPPLSPFPTSLCAVK